MAVRKALSYSGKEARPYTRNSRIKRLAYVKTVPHNKIVKYQSGNYKDYFEGRHNHIVSLVAEANSQIRDIALEAGRLQLLKVLEQDAPGQYFMEIKVHPHHFQRENKSAAAVAGADRISTGMTQSFGTIIGRAAFVKRGQEIFIVSCANEKTARMVKDLFSSIRPKIPCRTKIVFNRIR